jgi:leucyl aminopeptidase
MKILPTNEPICEAAVDAVVVGVCSGEGASDVIAGPAGEIDKAGGGALTRLFEAKEFAGKLDQFTTLLAPAGVKALKVVVAGLGPQSELSQNTAFRAAAGAAKSLAGKACPKVAFYLGRGLPADVAAAGVCGAMVGCQGQDLYRKEKKQNPFDEIHWHGADQQTLAVGQILGESVNLTRRLVNEPPSDMNPAAFADTAAVIGKDAGFAVEVWNKQQLEQERCGSLLAVARGSVKEPRLVIMTYSGGGQSGKTLALVGKGVTFDSGGLSLKPTDNMKTMKCDMAGAATVLGAMRAIAKLKLPVNVIGLAGLVENMVSGDSYKLGDVLTARNGKTIEVLNTDAEGRLVLADVLTVAVDRGAEKIIDLATLTGACVVALGMDVAGLMTNDQSWCDAVRAAADKCGEAAWQLPMFESYAEDIKSGVADIKNVGNGRWGGAITAAKFLEEFVSGKPWTHMDIAGPSFVENSKPWIEGGGSGAFVRTLVEVARGWNGQ